MDVFERWGHFTFRHRTSVVAASAALLILSVAVLSVGGNLSDRETVPTESSRADALLSTELAHGPATTDFALVFSSRTLYAQDPSFQAAMALALAHLRTAPHVLRVVTPATSPAAAAQLISTDRHSAVADVVLNDTYDTATAYYADLRALVHSSALTISAAGALPINQDYQRLLAAGESASATVAIPVALLLLLILFGVAVAAVLPIAVGLATVLSGTAAAFALSHATTLASATSEFVTFLGLGLAIDYSVFVVSRFREELSSGRSVEASISSAMTTAGKAILFSGLTVMTGLSGLFFFNGTWLGQLAAPLVTLVAIAMLLGMTLLPAMLAILGQRINAWRLPGLSHRADAPSRFWHALATRVMRRPLWVLLPTLAVVLLAASPLASISLATDHGGSLPVSAESRRGNDALLADFPRLGQTTIPVVVQYAEGQPQSPTHAAEIRSLRARMAALPGVVDISQTSGPDIVAMSVITTYQDQSGAARHLVQEIRSLRAGVSGDLLVTGSTASDLDRTAWLLGRAPLALVFVLGTTFVILLFLLRSLVLPLKAVITNLISISAAFGVMVWGFQQGHLASLLGFTPTAVDPTVPVAMFCVLFGLSMDYEVFLLSRIREEYVASGDNKRAVATGLERCGRLVTFAAAIMAVVFAAFALGGVTVIKMVGVGTATAILVDATLMRGLLVPAAMVLLGRANWWAPRWLHKETHPAIRPNLTDAPELRWHAHERRGRCPLWREQPSPPLP